MVIHHKLIKELEIPAVKTGLTAMQLVNTLVFSKVIRMPTVMEMGQWISDNPTLGAVAGLKFLGFEPAKDQEDLGFHPPFTEHLLCKTPRWNRLLGDDKSNTLLKIAAKLGDVAWTSGKNLTDPCALPLPLKITRQHLESALKSEASTIVAGPNEEEPESETSDNNTTGTGGHLTDKTGSISQPEFVQGSSQTGRIVEDFSLTQ
ncbi:hypothetical protein B0H14DRAFT_3531222 [Mycena olivaceomarginata]|nr:hypothetical protein B0H14DRAFT_3531222 [Mycena olivaceomarginata]